MDKVLPHGTIMVLPPHQKEGRLKRRLMLHVVSTLLCGVAVTCAVSILLIQSEFPSWVRATKAAMLSAEKASLGRVTAEKAAFTTEVLRRVELDVAFWAGSLRDAVLGHGAAARDAEVALAPALTRQGWTRASSEARDVAGWYAHGQTRAADCGGTAAACRSWPPAGTFELWHNASRAAPFAASFKDSAGAGRDYDLVYAGLEDAAGSSKTLYLHYPAAPAASAATSSYDGYATKVYHCDRRSHYSAVMTDAERRAEWDAHVAAGNCADAAGACQRLTARMNGGGGGGGGSSVCAAACKSGGRYSSADPCAGDGYCVSAGLCTNDAAACATAGKGGMCSGCAKSAPPFVDTALGRQYQKIGYDPRCRGWYNQAKEQGGKDKGRRRVIFTSPYEFADGGMGMTAAAALYEAPPAAWGAAPSAALLGTLRFLGVAAIDFSLGAVDANLAGMRVAAMPSTYGYLVASDGIVASHARLDRAAMLGEASLLRAVDGAPTAAASAAWDGAARAMRDGCNATIEYAGRVDDAAGGDKGKWFLSYAPETTAMEAPRCAGALAPNGAASAFGVPLWALPGKGGLRSQGFAVGVSVSQADVFAPIRRTEEEINGKLAASFGLLAGLLSILFFAVLAVANALTNGVVRPVNKLLRTVRELNAHNFDVELDLGDDAAANASSPEMAAMMALFAKMACVVKFANVSLTAGNLDSAAKTFREALSMFTALDNHKGMGVCRNNLGNACLLQAHQAEQAEGAAGVTSKAMALYAEAETFFRLACEDAEAKLSTMPHARQVVHSIATQGIASAVYQGATAVAAPSAAAAAAAATTSAAADAASAHAGQHGLAATVDDEPPSSTMEAKAFAFVKQLANRKHNLSLCLAAQARHLARACAAAEGSQHAGDRCAEALGSVNAALAALQQVAQLESHAMVATTGVSKSGRDLTGVTTVHTNVPRAVDIKLEEATLHLTAALVFRCGGGADAAEQAQAALAQADAGFDAVQGLVDAAAAAPAGGGVPPCALQQRLNLARAARHWPAETPDAPRPPPHEEQERAAELYLRVLAPTAGAQIDVRAALAAGQELAARTTPTERNQHHSKLLHPLASEWQRAADAALDALQPLLEAAGLRNGTPPKDVVFIMDRSGSMAGGRMRSASENMLKVVDAYVDDRDSIGFVAFAERVQEVFGVQEVGAQRARLRGIMQAECNRTGGRTSFRDAVWAALTMLDTTRERRRHARHRRQRHRPERGEAAKDGRLQFVVALTDGADNMSSQSISNLAKRLSTGSHMVNFIVIGLSIEDSVAQQVRSLTDASEGGVYIDARETSELAAAFEQVAELIQGPNLNVETY